VAADYRSLIDGYLANVAAANGASNNVYANDTQYWDNGGPIVSASSFDGSLVDTAAFPANGCSYSGVSVCLTDAQLRTELSRAIASKGWAPGPNKLFFIFTPKGVGSCFDSTGGDCAYTYYCGYHNWYGSGSAAPLIWANEPYLGGTVCDIGQHPNGSDGDATINVVSHEHNEAVTDPQGSGWWDDSGYEIGDKCAWNFGTALGSTSYGPYNQVIGSGRYYLQQEWSNDDATCVLSFAIGRPVNLSPPTLAGFPVVGQGLTATTGTWTGNQPMSYTYRFQDCDVYGASCVDIADSTGKDKLGKQIDPNASWHTLQNYDLGHTVRVIVTAKNTLGYGNASSQVTSVVVVGPPVNGGLPFLRGGGTQVGQTVFSSPGVWDGYTPLVYTYMFQDCDTSGANCVDIADSTGKDKLGRQIDPTASWHTLQTYDVGHTIRAVVTVTNRFGSASARTAPSGVIH
jgi:hypothetical protein